MGKSFHQVNDSQNKCWSNYAQTIEGAYPPVNIPIPTKIGSKMGGAPKTQKWDPKTVLNRGRIPRSSSREVRIRWRQLFSFVSILV